MSQENLEIARRALDLNRSGPPDETSEAVVKLCDPSVVFVSRVTEVEGGTYRGHEGIRRYFDDMAAAFSEWWNVTEKAVAVSGEAVLADLVFHGVGKESGVAVELRSTGVFVFSGEKVLRCEVHATREDALEAAGLSE